MRDPFFIPPSPWLVDLVQPWCERLGFPTLALHIHEVLAAAIGYTLVFWPISPIVSKLLASKHYVKLSPQKRLNWDAHVVSMFQSTLIIILASWVMLVDDDRRAMNWEERVWGYTGAAGMIQALAAGYFVWDLIITSWNIDVFGFGTLAHAISALFVYIFGFRPFLNYYGCIFILWELSTPFLNIHWFMDKIGMTGSRMQLYNGFLLLFSFFCCRLIYGTYQSVLAFRDTWAAIDRHPTQHLHNSTVMAFATDESSVPMWLGAVYLASNLTLNSLNFYWFVMMIRAVRKRFEPSRHKTTEMDIAKPYSTSSVSSDGKPRRRKV
ncbi:hypothetical protein RJ55_06729 [Drechmeria coniospora]|nr:hypothetical protein RJ55_06729 [Drechmeria coniospora]